MSIGSVYLYFRRNSYMQIDEFLSPNYEEIRVKHGMLKIPNKPNIINVREDLFEIRISETEVKYISTGYYYNCGEIDHITLCDSLKLVARLDYETMNKSYCIVKLGVPYSECAPVNEESAMSILHLIEK